MNYGKQVKKFHKKFGHPAPSTLTLPSATDQAWVEARKSLIKEEAAELVEAIEMDNLVKISREAVDVAYVAIGTLVGLGIPFADIWHLVHAANMAKTKPPADAAPGTKPLKPESWVSPDDRIADLLKGIILDQPFEVKK